MTTPTPTKRLSNHWYTVFTPISALPDGTPIYGTHDTDGSALNVKLELNDRDYLVCDESGYVSGRWQGVDVEMTGEEMAALTQLCASGLLPFLHGLARRWNGDTNAPVPSVPIVAYEHQVSEPDSVDGSVIRGSSFTCGAGDDTVEVWFSDGDTRGELYLFGRDGLPLAWVARVLPNLVAIVNDPRVQAMAAESGGIR